MPHAATPPPTPHPSLAGWQTVGSASYALGESPFWHPHEQQLYWVDIAGKQLLRANVYMGDVQAWPMPSEPGCIAPAEGGGLVIALRHGIFRARTWGGALEHIATLPYDSATVRANDGKCDALGRFWVGTIDETKAHNAAALYCIDARGQSTSVQRMAGDALTGNGLAWSLDGHTLYWADTPRHTVHAWDYQAQPPALNAHRTHLHFAPKPADWHANDPRPYQGRPDGAAVDTQGNYWVALYEGQRVCCFAPDGTLLHTLPTPAVCPTMPCFGGEDLQTLYLTSAQQGRSPEERSAYPHSGAVFSRRVGTAGQAVRFFRQYAT